MKEAWESLSERDRLMLDAYVSGHAAEKHRPQLVIEDNCFLVKVGLGVCGSPFRPSHV